MPTKKNAIRPTYHAKVLLFGEHIINRQANGLAIPTARFSASFDFIQQTSTEDAMLSNKAIQALAAYIMYEPYLCTVYNTNQLLDDLERGLYFESDFPQGYGMGSSGAIVAAICREYRSTPIHKRDIHALKAELALIESHFHGRSSGLDPLVCFLNQAVLIESGQVSKIFDLKKPKGTHFKIFLLNTAIPRSTSPWVNLFIEKCKDKKFEQMLNESLIKANNLCIQSLLKSNYASFWKSLKLISQLQYDYMPEFIPDAYEKVWQQGLTYNDYYLKLCGAGGGGFILGFCKKDTDLKSLFSGYEVIDIEVI